MGSLNDFVPGAGYWFKTDGTGTSFEYPVPDPSNLSRKIAKLPAVPIEYHYQQSTQQAFYFIENLNMSNYPELANTEQMQNGVWLLAYCGDILVGAREWNGPYTDIPVMGDDGSIWTVGYLEAGGIPLFKVYDDSLHNFEIVY